MKNALLKYLLCFLAYTIMLYIPTGRSQGEELPGKKVDSIKSRNIYNGTPFLTIGIAPQYLATDGLKLEVGYFVDKFDYWINVGFIGYAGSINANWKANTSISSVKLSKYTEKVPYDNLNGEGFSLANRFMLDNGGAGRLYSVQAFVGLSLDYRIQHITYYETGWQQTNNGGLIYYNYGNVQHKGQISSASLSGLIGFRGTTGIFFTDIYAGLGYRIANPDHELASYRNYTRTLFDYSYSGPFPVVNLTFGIMVSQ